VREPRREQFLDGHRPLRRDRSYSASRSVHFRLEIGPEMMCVHQ